ncbi:alkene reductase [Piscinibacter sakaiensis]|uniref:2,4-dienoyl-CoA reductase [NADPH] n=1 Tax=Piscinibacter sakaiensis TaxID=1547922 RepID=A0A0K8P1D7_PISS1|nr:alkene reductase [Piscinibacter sakaiensis]GAP36477.1 2,4-dienoyl-CoA reductase [NADPH] [Piscinibacter sakaiensis]
MSTLFDPIRIGDIPLANRVVMAPLTRDRAPDRIPTDLTTLYYRQRAGAGLIVSEGTQISPEGQGYLDTPGIHGDAQIAAWRRVTDAVHEVGGRIVVQLWHVGRISHVSLLPPGTQPVSSTARAANTKTFTAQGFEPVSAPRALRLDEMPRLVDDYRRAARNAVRAGFDGVEIHAANNYLLEQFLRDATNDRQDAYGGSIANRTRLPAEVARAVADEIGAGRTGIRLSPVTPVNDGGQDSDAQALYGHLVDQLADARLAFVHVIEGQTGGPRDVAPFDFEALRRRWKERHPDGAWIVNNGYTRQMALDAVAAGRADAVAFGKAFISNPDLVHRLRIDAPLAPPNPKTFYGGGAEGYTDYPSLETAAA